MSNYSTVTVGELIKSLQKLDPNLPCVTSADDEGNSHREVIFKPSVGYFSGFDFVTDSDLESDYKKDDPLMVKVMDSLNEIKKTGIRAVCIN